MHKASGFIAGYLHKSGMDKHASLEKQARHIAEGQASFLKALFPTMNVNYAGESIQPMDIKHNWSRETFKLPSAAMTTGKDTRTVHR